MPLPKSFKLSSGYSMPAIGFGTWDAVEAQRTALLDATVIALKTGYRSVDTAWSYGTEGPVGEAIRKSGVPRSEIFLTTKVYCSLFGFGSGGLMSRWNHMHGNVKKSCEMSLESLGEGIGYIDLMLLHWPIAFKAEADGVTIANHPDGKPIIDEERSNDHSETWKAMEGLVASGKVRSIGVSNFNVSQLKKLLKTAKIQPAVHQIEIHPFPPASKKCLMSRWLTQPELHKFCRDHNILLTAYSPLGGQHPGGHAKHGGQSPLKDETILKVAKKMNKEPAQVILSWLVQRGVAVIPKSSTESRIKSNFELFELDKEDFDAIEGITAEKGQKRYCNLDGMWGSHLFEEEVL